MKKTIFSLLLLVPLAMNCTEPLENPNPCEALSQVDREMLDLVAQIEAAYKADTEFLTAFKNSQIYWTQYRNRQVKAVFPLSPRKYNYDVGACKCEIMLDMTKLRIKELRQWTDGVTSSDCVGTYKSKKD